MPLYKSASGQIALWCDGDPASSLILGPVASGWLPAGIANFTGGSISDILLYSPSNGLVSVWPGGVAASGVITGQVNLAAGYTILNSFGDFNGDGHDDLVVYSTSNRTVAIWYSASLATSAIVGQYVAGWTPYHVADVDGDGLADLILRETGPSGTPTGRYSYWPSGNPNLYEMMAAPGNPWELMATGDFRSGAPACDVLWYNTYSGEMATSVDCSSVTLQGFASNGLLGRSVRPIMAEDMNGDGITDLVSAHYYNRTISMMVGADSSALTVLGRYAASSGWAPLVHQLPYEVHYR